MWIRILSIFSMWILILSIFSMWIRILSIFNIWIRILSIFSIWIRILSIFSIWIRIPSIFSIWIRIFQFLAWGSGFGPKRADPNHQHGHLLCRALEKQTFVFLLSRNSINTPSFRVSYIIRATELNLSSLQQGEYRIFFY